MTTKLLLKYVNLTDLAISIGLVVLLWRKHKFDDFKLFVIYLCGRIASSCISIPILFFRKQTHLPLVIAYRLLWASNWTFFIVQAALQTFTIYAIYRLAMKPLPGLQRIGQLLFRWIAGISFGLSVFFAMGPKVGTSDYWSLLTGQTHQGVNVLSLCLLFFVCLAIRPLGLTFRSHIFGVSLGLGINAAADLIGAAWFSTAEAHSLYSTLYLWLAVASFFALLVWVAYFALPEPERKMVLLPTTSPFFVWNSISEALGDEPGYVAVAGFTPDMLSSAEIEELSRPPQAYSALERELGKDDKDDDPEGPPPSKLSLHSINTL